VDFSSAVGGEVVGDGAVLLYSRRESRLDLSTSFPRVVGRSRWHLNRCSQPKVIIAEHAL